MVRTDLFPVMMTLPTRRSVIRVTRVPCVGEVIFLADPSGPDGGTRWLVLSVQHVPVMEDGTQPREVVAEIHCVEATEFDPWDGKDPSQATRRPAGFQAQG